MRHLDSGDLLDLAEGTRGEASAPHLASCDVCRQELAALRQTLASVADVTVPEPSPLFWDHLAARVRESVAADAGLRPAWWSVWLPRLAAPLAAAVVVVALVMAPWDWSSAPPQTGGVPTPAVLESVDADALGPTEASIVLLGDLVRDLDWDGAAEAGLTTSPGVFERVVFELSDEERLVLHGLLQDELGRGGVL